MSASAPRPNGPPPHLTCGLLAWEPVDAFIALWQAYLEAYDPIGPAETGLAEQLVWLDWRRRRLRLGERALHMASLDRATGRECDDRLTRRECNDRLTRRALAVSDGTRPDRSSAEAVRADDDEDTKSASEWRDMLDAAETAKALVDTHGEAGYADAVASLPPETAAWFLEECDLPDKFTADADGLKRFLGVEVLPWFRAQLAGAEGGPAVRVQAWGESLDPDRMDKLLARWPCCLPLPGRMMALRPPLASKRAARCQRGPYHRMGRGSRGCGPMVPWT